MQSEPRAQQASATQVEERLPAALVADAHAGPDRDMLAFEWRRLTRFATVVAVLTSPVVFAVLYLEEDIALHWSILATIGVCLAFRGAVDIVVRRFVPWPSLFGQDDARLREEDVINRRRAWFWRRLFRLVILLAPIVTGIYFAWGFLSQNPQLLIYLIIFPLFMVMNFAILFGPLAFMGISQIKAYEPGDADWGVKLSDVRGQFEAKEEVRRVVTLWQSGEAFERAGGKRERGLLLLGAPGTGKTMLSKAIATNFNAPFVSIPGSGFAATFIGIDVVIVRFLVFKAKRLARKWGGQCIVFIDEIDAVGMRRRSLGSSFTSASPAAFEDHCFYGPNGALTPSGDLVLETRAWRERLFEERAEPSVSPYPAFARRLGAIANVMFPGGMGGMGTGQLALNQLLIVMDGIGEPPFWRKFWTNRINTWLDASYVVPQRIGSVRLRLRKPKPRTEQIFFVGACNVPLEALDPALTRPGRMGRHVWFRTPTKQDRLDVFDLYIDKVAHEPDLDTDKRREEIARITNGYSPAMIEQVCSMALTIAHFNGRERFGWDDIVEAMTSIEAGTAVNVEYVPEETRAVAIHEAGHAVAAHVYMEGAESTRLSIRRRGRALGHHQALEKEERFSSWRHEEMGRLIWTLGAMAAERVFYGENSTGVGGDVQSATARAGWMVGSCAMAPERIELPDVYESREAEDEARDRIMKRFERIGAQIMRRSGSGGPLDADPIAGVFSDREKRAMACQILGQAYLKAHHLIAANREAVDRIATVLAERKELHGDEVLDLLDGAKLRVPDVDLTDDATWPAL
ncbi:MAG: AAA family ATPase [Thermoleophilia bacterium]